MRKAHRALGVFVATVILAGTFSGVAWAKGPRRTSSALSLVLLNSTDGVAHYGQQVTFEVSTTATDRPYVKLNCYQGSTWVYWASAGFFDGYPWPWTRNFTLSSDYWTGGPADCTAEMYSVSSDGRHTRTLATLSFSVAV